LFNIYTLDDKEKWQNIVDSFNNNDIYYYPEYVQAYKVNGDGEPILIHYFDGNIEALNVVIKRDLSKIDKFKSTIEPNTIFDFITPYGYGGILFKKKYSNKDIKFFFNEYKLFCKKNNVVTEFIRFHPILRNYLNIEKHIEIIDAGPTVCVSTTNFNQSWTNFSSKNRNVIRKSQRNGVEIYWGLSKELLKEFKRLYKETMDKDLADQYYYFSESFFESLISDLKYKMLFFYAKFDGKIISISSIMIHKNLIHYHLSASDKNYRHLSPTNLLLSEVVRYASENNIQKLHLGGGLGGRQDNLYNFKKSFNRLDDYSFKVGKIVYNTDLYKNLVYNIDSSDYFPLYRNK
jgi:hypothetical protein